MRIIKDYPVYRDEWRKYVEAITAPGVAPDARFCGPSATPGKTAWARDFVGDFGKSGRIAFISQHDYPGGAGNRATNVVAARDKMLSAVWVKGYGIKAFDLASHGRSVPVSLSASAKDLNLTAYGVLAADESLYITLINKEHNSSARDAAVTIALGDGFASGQVMWLTAGQVAATSGVTLGGAEIKDDASWKGAWTPLTTRSTSGQFTLKLPSATAAVVKLAR